MLIAQSLSSWERDVNHLVNLTRKSGEGCIRFFRMRAAFPCYNNYMRHIILIILSIFMASAVFAAEVKVEKLPSKVELKVPFLCQAPYANWKMPYKEACEEAALIMAFAFAHGIEDKTIGKEAGKQEILGLVRYQKRKFGGHFDLTAKQTAKLFKDYYKFEHFKLVYDFTIKDINKELAKGNLVLVPAAGRLLGNKFFKVPGPIYHFLTVKGYDMKKREFITNDPGTRRGRGYRYKFKTLYNAIHDWTGKGATINLGRKAMLVVTP